MPLLLKMLLGLIALAVVGAGAATAFVLVVLNNPSEATAQYIPSSAPAYFSVNLRPGLRQTLNAASFFSKIDSDELEDWREEQLDEVEDETGIHPTEDVDFWLGTDISAAILNDDIDDLEWVVMFQVGEREGAEDFADDLADYISDESGMDLDEDSSDDLSLWIAEDDEIAIALSDEYLLIGDSEDTVTDIAENVEEPLRKSLLDNESFVAARGAAPTPRVAFGYIDLEALWPGQTDLLDLGVTSEQLRGELEGNWPVYISMSTSFQGDALRFDLSYLLEEETIDWEGYPVQAQQVLPSDSLIAISTTELLEAWDQWWDIIEETDPYTADDLRQIRSDFETEVGIDLEEDFRDTLSGELAAALLPSDFDFSSEEAALDSPIHALLLAQLEDSETLQDSLDELLENLEESPDFDPERVEVGEFEAVTVPLHQFDVVTEEYTPGIVVMEDWAALGSTLESLEMFNDTVTGETDSLDDNEEFRRALDVAPSPIHHFTFVSIAGLVEALDEALSGEERRTFRNDVRPYVENLSAFLITSSVTLQEVRISAILTAVE